MKTIAGLIVLIIFGVVLSASLGIMAALFKLSYDFILSQ